ncbi:uncharacterized protein RCO7_15041 [Rhynchosporium graminicola]|uniref:Uncharacterized protein n=1 Tax=Rhynchosporium graminicola TaxID=2792576 RepID=A0A1E1LGX6_9HELO|nr:uncharacterized protein RCO7_15041 [Rhynchosporium commune]
MDFNNPVRHCAPVRKMSKVIGLRRRVFATRNTCMESNDVKKDPPTPAALTWTFSSPQASPNSTNTTYNRRLLRARNMIARFPSKLEKQNLSDQYLVRPDEQRRISN